MKTKPPSLENSEAAIFARVWDNMPNSFARQIVKLRFSDADLARMHELSERNRCGTLTNSEEEELDNFVKAADLLAIVQSKARRMLKRVSSSRNGRG